VTPVGFADIGWKYFIVYACTNFFLIVPCKSWYALVHSHDTDYRTSPAVYFFFPETSGRHLEEVDQIFRDSSSIFQPVKVAAQLPMHQIAVEHVQEKGQAKTMEHGNDAVS
jgi:hypothetical protein